MGATVAASLRPRDWLFIYLRKRDKTHAHGLINQQGTCRTFLPGKDITGAGYCLGDRLWDWVLHLKT